MLQAMSPVRQTTLTEEHSGEATECSDGTFVSAGSTIEVTLLNGDVLHSETLSMGMHESRLRKDTLEDYVLTMNIPRAAADLVLLPFEMRADGNLMVRFNFCYEKIGDETYERMHESRGHISDYCLVCLDPAIDIDEDKNRSREENCIRCIPCSLCDLCKIKTGHSPVCLWCVEEDEIELLSDAERFRYYFVTEEDVQTWHA